MDASTNPPVEEADIRAEPLTNHLITLRSAFDTLIQEVESRQVPEGSEGGLSIYKALHDGSRPLTKYIDANWRSRFVSLARGDAQDLFEPAEIDERNEDMLDLYENLTTRRMLLVEKTYDAWRNPNPGLNASELLNSVRTLISVLDDPATKNGHLHPQWYMNREGITAEETKQYCNSISSLCYSIDQCLFSALGGK